ncbi:hypothetical protein PTKIN_Ptkin06aG0110000 [Pterospermum kingtungense]
MCSLSSDRPLCHSDEQLALLQFKESLVVEKEASVYEFAYPKANDGNFKGLIAAYGKALSVTITLVISSEIPSRLGNLTMLTYLNL